MVKVCTSPDCFRSATGKKVFLAGSIDNNSAADWQTEVITKFANEDVTLLNPRRVEWNPEWEQDISNPEFAFQVNWELDALEAADLIMLYFDPNGPAPITLLELGLFAKSKKIILCCPEGYWRRGNVQVVCERYGIEMVADLDALIQRTRERLELCGQTELTLDLDREVLFDSAMMAHERGLTLNEYFRECIQTHIDLSDKTLTE
jgi:hypothetical protein